MSLFAMLKYSIRLIRIFGLSENTLFGLPIDEKSWPNLS